MDNRYRSMAPYLVTLSIERQALICDQAQYMLARINPEHPNLQVESLHHWVCMVGELIAKLSSQH